MGKINLNVKGTTLYDNIEGTPNSVILKDSLNNYNAVEIYYGQDGFYCTTGKIPNPNNKKISTPLIFNSITQGRTFIYVSNWQINNNAITFLSANNLALTANINSQGIDPYVKIYKIVGYK